MNTRKLVFAGVQLATGLVLMVVVLLLPGVAHGADQVVANTHDDGPGSLR